MYNVFNSIPSITVQDNLIMTHEKQISGSIVFVVIIELTKLMNDCVFIKYTYCSYGKTNSSFRFGCIV